MHISCGNIPVLLKNSLLFVFNIEFNSKSIDVPVNGIGEKLLLDVKPVVPEGAPAVDKVTIGPILPYNKYGYKLIEFTNPNDSEIEVYSSDFDKTYLNEERMLKNFKPFVNDPEEKMDIKIRKAGDPIWPKFDNFNKELNAKISKEFLKEKKHRNSVLINLDFGNDQNFHNNSKNLYFNIFLNSLSTSFSIIIKAC